MSSRIERHRNYARRMRRYLIGKAIHDGQGCAVCGYSYHDVLSLHHKKPLSRGGGSAPDNFALLCPNCHALAHYIRRRHWKKDEVWKATLTFLSPEAIDRLLEIARHGVPVRTVTPVEELDDFDASVFDDWIPPIDDYVEDMRSDARAD